MRCWQEDKGELKVVGSIMFMKPEEEFKKKQPRMRKQEHRMEDERGKR